MNKIVNGVANDYEFPDLDWVHHDSKTSEPLERQIQTFTRWQDPTIEEYKKEIIQLTNNWNELEEWCKNNLGYYGEEDGYVYKYMLDKMKEIKEGK